MKDFVYRRLSAKDRVWKWQDRALVKNHFPGAPHITVYQAVGYNLVGSFRTVEWTTEMLSTEAIPSSKTEERLWASILLAILGYAYHVSDLQLEDEKSIFTSRHREDKSIIVEVENEVAGLGERGSFIPFREKGHPMHSASTRL